MWPIYFATKALKARRVALEVGQPFPYQEKHYIRGLGRAYGVANADELGFGELPYVGVLNAHSPELARNILKQGLSLEEASKLTGVTSPAKGKAKGAK